MVVAGPDEVERRFDSDGPRTQPAAGMLLMPVAVFWQTVAVAWIHLHPCPFPQSPFYPSSTEKRRKKEQTKQTIQFL